VRTTALLVWFALFGTMPVAAQTTLLDRWRVEKPGPAIETASEILRVSGGRGWIRTPGVFQDFILRLQFRPTPSADGAVLLRAYLLKPAAWPASGLRVALNGGKRSAGDVTAFHGKVKDVAARQERLITPAEWHDLEIRAERRMITVTIDGVAVRRVEEPENWGAGHIGLEGRAGAIDYRRIEVQPLGFDGTCKAPAWIEEVHDVVKSGAAGVTTPRLRKSERPRYTAEAMRRRVQGTVRLEGVVLPDGSVGNVCVGEQLDSDLDAEAVAAAKKFLFYPGTMDGRPVAVLVSFEISFVLGD